MILYDKDGNLITEEQLEEILANPGDPIFQFILEKYGFVWEEASQTSPTILHTAAVYPDGRAILAWYSGQNLNWWIWEVGGGLPSTGAYVTGLTVTGISVADNSAVLFYSSSGSVHKYDIGLAINTPNVYIGTGAIIAIAAASDSVVHVAEDYGAGVTRFVRAGESTVQSELYWPFAIDGFGCRTLANGDEILVVSNGYAPYRAARAYGTQVSWATREMYAVVSFVYREGVYSDHYDVILADDYIGQSAAYARIFSCAWGVGAIFRYGTHEITGHFVSISSDGRYWELPIPLSITEDAPCYLVATEEYLYLWHNGDLHVSQINYRFGYHNERVFDITPYVSQGAINTRVKAGITLSQISITDELLEFVDSEEEMLLIAAAGYQYGTGQVFPQIFIGAVSQMEVQRQGGGGWMLQLQAEDMLAFLGRQTLFDQLHDGILGGFDPYTDLNETGTEYGGLAHTGAQKGAWRSPEHETYGYVLEPTSGGRSVAFKTFNSAALNGWIRSWCFTDKADGSEKFGLCGRGMAPYLLTEALYTPGETLVLRHYHGTQNEEGVYNQTVLATRNVNASTSFWMLYQFRYALHRVWKSMDGIAWNRILEAISPVGCYAGHLGLVAEQPDPAPWSPGDTPDFPWDPWVPPPEPPEPPPEPVYCDGSHVGIVRRVYSTDVFIVNVTENAFASMDPTPLVSWTDVTRNLNTLLQSVAEVAWMPIDIDFAQGGDYPLGLYVMARDPAATKCHLFYLRDPYDDGTEQWTEVTLPVGYRIQYATNETYMSGILPNPGFTGEILIRLYKDPFDAARRFNIIVEDGIVTREPSFCGNGDFHGTVWYDEDTIYSSTSYWNGFFWFYMHILMPKETVGVDPIPGGAGNNTLYRTWALSFSECGEGSCQYVSTNIYRCPKWILGPPVVVTGRYMFTVPTGVNNPLAASLAASCNNPEEEYTFATRSGTAYLGGRNYCWTTHPDSEPGEICAQQGGGTPNDIYYSTDGFVTSAILGTPASINGKTLGSQVRMPLMLNGRFVTYRQKSSTSAGYGFAFMRWTEELGWEDISTNITNLTRDSASANNRQICQCYGQIAGGTPE